MTLDTLRWDGLMADSGEASSMPLLWQRAQDGAIWTNAFAATSATQPTHASIFTGLAPWEHGVTRNGQILPEALTTVPEVLAENGFQTGAVVSSFPVERRFGFAQGFGAYRDQFEETLPLENWEGAPGPDGQRFYSKAESVTREALALLDAADRDRQFLWLHYFDPHGPYGDSGAERQVGPAWILSLARRGKPTDEAFEVCREAYDRDLAYLDRWLETLFERLDQDSERFETHVVLTSDHGESFGEGGAIAHGKRLTDEQIRVPLIVLSPHAPRGERAEVTGSADLAATLLGLAELDPRASGVGGRDLLTSARKTPARASGMRRTFKAQRVVERRSDGTVLPIEGYRFFVVDPDGTVYRGNGSRVEAPPGAPHAEAARHLFARWESELDDGVSATADPDPETAKALAALGYVD